MIICQNGLTNSLHTISSAVRHIPTERIILKYKGLIEEKQN